MGYFDKFPSLYYDIKGTQKYELVVDILRRVKINHNEVNSALYGEYTIKEHDRPDTIAEKLYEDSNLHWVILLFNEIHNPYYEWPMKRQELLDYCAEKYPGNAFLIELDPIKDSPLRDVRRRRDHKVVDGYYVFAITGESLDTAGPIASVLCWDRTYSKAIVVQERGNFDIGTHIGIGVTGTYQATASGILRRNQLNIQGLNHFVDDTGNILTPLGSYDALIQRGEKLQETSTLDAYGRSAPLPFDQTLLGAYLQGNDQLINAVTNFEHEDKINEERRNILLPHPNIVREITTRFENIINEGV